MTTATTTAQLATLTSRFAALTSDLDDVLARPTPPAARILWQTLRWGTHTLVGLFEAIRDAYARLLAALNVVAPALGATTTALLAADGVTATPVETWKALAARLSRACAGVDDLGCIAAALEELRGQPAYAPLQDLLAARVLTALRAELDASFSPAEQDLASLLGLWQALDAGRDANGVLSIAHILAVGAQQQNPAVRAAIEARLSVAGQQPLPTPPGYQLGTRQGDRFDVLLTVGGSSEAFAGRVEPQDRGLYIWLPTSIFGPFINNPATPSELQITRRLQSRYGLLALRVAWDLYADQTADVALDLDLLLAILYWGELGPRATEVRLEALARSRLGANGLCGPGLTCTSFDVMSNALADAEFWFNRTETVNAAGVTQANVPWARTRIDGTAGGRGLLQAARVTTLRQAVAGDVGPFAVDVFVASLFTDSAGRAWLLPPGQRADRPSRWGNIVVRKSSVTQNSSLQEATSTVIARGASNSVVVYDYNLTEFNEECWSMFVVVNNIGLDLETLRNCPPQE